jgi:O-antigen/teichoic acid export membrane protein
VALISFLTGGGSPRQRIGFSVAATGFGRLVTVAYNFVLVPVLLSAWGIQIYGEWIVLSAIASMASLSNVGFVQASASEIIMRISAGDHEEAEKVMSTTLLSLILLAAIVFAIGAAIVHGTPPALLFSVKAISANEARLVVDLSLASVLIGFLTGPISAAIAANSGAGLPQTVLALIKVGELVVVAIVALAGGRPGNVASVLVLSGTLSVFALMMIMRHLTPWLHISPLRFDKATFRRLLHPSLGQFLLYASYNIIAIQLPRIVLGHLAGAAGVAVYSIAVTYTRAARMLTSSLAQSFQIELTRSYGEAKLALTVRLVETACQLGFWITGLATIAMLIGAGPAFEIWTRGRIGADHITIAVLGAATIFGAYNEGFMYLLSGVNRVWAIASGHFAASITALALGVAIYPFLGIRGFAATLILPELTVATVGVIDSARILRIDPYQLFARSLKIPIQSVREEASRAAAFFMRSQRP